MYSVEWQPLLNTYYGHGLSLNVQHNSIVYYHIYGAD